jgi:hypothetical protein
MKITRLQWGNQLMDTLGLAHRKATERALVAWLAAEGTQAKWNPLATTLRRPGSTNFNSVGVQNYLTLCQGLEATTLTLDEPGHGYGKILRKLENPNATASDILTAVAESDWGTGELALSILDDVKRDWEAYSSVPVGQ